MTAPLLSFRNRMIRWPGGAWLFGVLVCRKAPYFASIAPRITALRAGHGEATMRHRRAVTNHIGTVHAIALCNLAELIGGLTTDVNIPASMRWIPKGMTVEYLAKATGTLHATATPAFAPTVAETGYALPVCVVIRNDAGEAVFRAEIAMWVSPRGARPG
ncbi:MULTISPECIES: hotdog fold domain-containing protein [Luteimonas]|uniref:hotdog fold domain-containing protein n=1 Tax=Luteimonas TaxID=83614 RepID=UPI000C7BCD47|nr:MULTISPECIES: hotdog fold domain-containing protein [Luteimonas]